MPKRIFIISGEPSGDLHGANLVKAILNLQADTEIACWGGDRMKAAGAKVLKHIDELAFMGFAEVVANLRTILRNFKLCKQQIEEFKPDVVVLIDYPGFNLLMAEHIHKLGIKNYYYISPQIWAWKENRVTKIKAFIDKVFVILPFEKDFYAKHGVEAEFVGHPLLDEIKRIEVDKEEFLSRKGIENQGKPIIALLPGSRTQEIKRLLPLMQTVTDRFPGYQFIISKVPWQGKSLFAECEQKGLSIAEGDTYELLSISEAAVVTSGTATLETALFRVPQVIVYRANWISYHIAKMLVKIRFIGLVNLVMDKEVVRELIQNEVNPKEIEKELSLILEGGEKRQQVLQDYDNMLAKLGKEGASQIVAKALLKTD